MSTFGLFFDVPTVGEICRGVRKELWEAMPGRQDISYRLFQAASLATDPLLRAHTDLRYQKVVASLNPESFAITNVARRAAVIGRMVLCGVVGAPLALVGIAVRSVADRILGQPYLHLRGNPVEKRQSDGTLSLFMWNICAVGGGYSLSDGGVVPWPQRINRIAERILQQQADVVCLCETMDAGSWQALYEEMKGDYSHFYVNMGKGGLVRSGLFVASKYPVRNPEFTAFDPEELDGRSKKSGKGFFRFDLEINRVTGATVFFSHLGHSEEPERATEGEEAARQAQVTRITDLMREVPRDRALILTGDLNMDRAERDRAITGELQDGEYPQEQRTWGGDKSCSELVGRNPSSALDLDYTLVWNRTTRGVTTDYADTDYDPEHITPEALSDHRGLYSTITLGPTIRSKL